MGPGLLFMAVVASVYVACLMGRGIQSGVGIAVAFGVIVLLAMGKCAL